MEKISEIFIKNFKCLNGFSLDLNNKSIESSLNLNLIIGRNGSGKSTFLDALYEIATNVNNPSKIFEYYLKDEKGEIICGNCSQKNFEKIEPISKKKFWEKVIKFYTGNSNRNIEYDDNFTNNFMSFERNDVKYVLTALFLSGAWSSSENKKILNEFKNIIFKDKTTFEPIKLWIDVVNYDKNSFEIKNDNFKEKEINGRARLFLNIADVKELTSSFSILNTLLNLYNAQTNEDNDITSTNVIIDTGFLYKKNCPQHNDTDLYIDETLSDGELGLIRRFALILLMKELKGEENRSLLLLDEPETHFNENWKRHFIYFVDEALKDTCHDVFIATHSAMLITDVKRDELYHFELVNDKIKTTSVCLNTYATNVVDIGQALFDLESGIGERSKKDIEAAIANGDKEELNTLLKQVGPGEWRWKIRAKLNQLEKADMCCNFKQREIKNGNSATID